MAFKSSMQSTDFYYAKHIKKIFFFIFASTKMEFSNYNYRLFQNSKRFPIILGTKKWLFKSVALNINFVLGIKQAFRSVYKHFKT